MSDWKIVVPEAGTNLLTNTSFETNTTGWTVGGTNTIAQSTAQSKFGSYSAICTYQDSTNLAIYAVTLTAAIHAFSIYVFIPSDWDGGAIRVTQGQFTSVVVNDSSENNTTTTGEWVRIWLSFTPDAGDLTGNLYVVANSAPTAGKFIYIDAAQCEQSSYITTYIDGDQGGCEWNGTNHASTSTRSAQSRAGGRVQDLQTDYSLQIEAMIDVSTAPLTQHTQEYAEVPGGETQGYKVHPRDFAIRGLIFSTTSQAGFHSTVQALYDVIKPDAVPGNQPVILRYTGGSVDKEIRARYLGGMEGQLAARDRFWSQVNIQFRADDPQWKQIGESSAALDTNDTPTINGIAGRLKSSGQWSGLGLSTSEKITVIFQASDKKVYVGGDFTDLDGEVGRDRLAYYDVFAGTWNNVGSASDIANGEVFAIVEAPNGDIYISGTFTSVAADGTIDYIARWDGSSWNSVGDPDNGAGTRNDIKAMAFDGNGLLYVGGDFTTIAGTANASYAATWDGSSWAAIGTPATGATVTDVFSIAIDAANDAYYAGDFTTWANTAGRDYLAKWDSSASSWGTVGSASDFGAAINAVVYDPVRDLIYIGGLFTNVGDANGDRITSWDGLSFISLGTGMGDEVTKLDVAPDGILYAVGNFQTAGGLTSVPLAARWNGSTWVHVDFFHSTKTISLGIGAQDPAIPRNYDAYVGWNGTITLYTAGATTVTNNGTAEAFPRFTFKRTGGTSATIKTVRNETTGKELFLNYALTNGETLTIDLAQAAKEIVSTFRGKQPDAVLVNSDFGSFSLQPGANTITAFVDIAGGPTVTTFCVWRDAYWGQD